MPMIRPVLVVVALLQIIWDLRVFAQIRRCRTAAPPSRDTHLLGNFIFDSASGEDFSWPAAVATIFVLPLRPLTAVTSAAS